MFSHCHLRRYAGYYYHPHSCLHIRANLSGVDLSRANLSVPSVMQMLLGHQGSVLDHVDLSGANLRMANLNHVTLRHTVLSGADLSETDLSEANLTGAIGITVEELEKKAKSLKGAIMPDGSKHP